MDDVDRHLNIVYERCTVSLWACKPQASTAPAASAHPSSGPGGRWQECPDKCPFMAVPVVEDCRPPAAGSRCLAHPLAVPLFTVSSNSVQDQHHRRSGSQGFILVAGTPPVQSYCSAIWAGYQLAIIPSVYCEGAEHCIMPARTRSAPVLVRLANSVLMRGYRSERELVSGKGKRSRPMIVCAFDWISQGVGRYGLRRDLQ